MINYLQTRQRWIVYAMLFASILMLHKNVYAQSESQPYTCADIDSINQLECTALQDLYDTGFGSYDWFTSDNPCSWNNINCNERISSLNLRLTTDEYNELPISIQNFLFLEQLRIINHDRLVELPSEIGELPALEALVISDNGALISLPDSIGNLDSLKNLVIYDNDSLVRLPDTVSQLPNLETLDIFGNDALQELPADLGEISSLRLLRIVNNDLLEELPDSFSTAINLNYLLIDGNDRITTIPPSMGQITNLRQLRIIGNDQLDTISDLSGLENLTNLNISSNHKITALPTNLDQLVSLQDVTLMLPQSASIEAFFDPITTIPSLEKLHLTVHSTEPIQFPDTLQEMTNLSYLSISGSVEYHDTFGFPPALLSLSLSYNSTPTLPDAIGELGQLKSLSINNHNNLSSLPTTLSNLTDLTQLSIFNNYNLYETEENLAVTQIENFPNMFNYYVNLQEVETPTDSTPTPTPTAIPLYTCNEITEIPQAECEALQSLYDAAELTQRSSYWFTSTRPCNWSYIQCTYHSDGAYITSLSISYLGRLREIPVEVGQLLNLKTLEIYGNDSLLNISDQFFLYFDELEELSIKNNGALQEIPATIGELTNLTNLQIESNSSIRAIPATIGDLPSITHLYIRDNSDITYLPSEIGDLSTLRRYEFSGDFSWPASFDNLPEIRPYSCDELIPNLGNDCAVLFELYELGVTPSSWFDNTNPCNWYNIRCNYNTDPVSISSVTIYGYSAEVFPDVVFELTNLEELYLYNFIAEKLSSTATTYPPIRELSLGNFSDLTEFPAFVSELTNLKELKISNVNLNTFSNDTFDSLTQLEYLSIVGNKNLEELPSFDSLTQLDSLSINQNPSLRELPSIDQLTQLRSLSINLNPALRELPEFDQITQLQSLQVSGNSGLVQFPDSTNLLSNLSRLSVQSNEQLQSFPNLSPDIDITSLNIYNNPELLTLGDGFGNLSQLDTLTIDGSPKLIIEDSIGGLQNLRHLYLHDSVVEISPEIGQLDGLISLRMNNTDVETLPEELVGLANLQRLDIVSNYELTSLPSQLNDLSNLNRLIIQDNPNLRTISPSLNQLVSLNQLSIIRNTNLTVSPQTADSLAQDQFPNMNSYQVEFNIEESIATDLNCDGIWNLLDIILIKQYDALMKEATTDCIETGSNQAVYIVGCDMNGDDKCGVIDATIIAQCNAFIINEYCVNLE